MAAGPVSLKLLFIIICTLVGSFYLFQSNRVSTAQLQVKDLEAKKAAVVENNERLSIEAARLQSVQQIKKSAEEQKLAQTQKAQAYERQGADQAVTATARSAAGPATKTAAE